VVLGVNASSSKKVSSFTERVGADLAAAGVETSLLVSGRGERVPAISAEVAPKLLPEGPADRLSDIWLSAVRHLEELAPCVYVTNQDWLVARTTVRLSNRVKVIGLLHENLPEEYENCAQLGDAWNAIVALDPAIRQRVIGGQPAHASRLARFPETPEAPDFIGSFLDLIERVSCDSTGFARIQAPMTAPPSLLVPDLPKNEVVGEVARVNAVPPWPEKARPTTPRQVRRSPVRPLDAHAFVFAVPTGRVSGVDVFTVNLVRSMHARGYRAEIIQTAPDAEIPDRIPTFDGVPAGRLPTGKHATWPERWNAMIAFLEERSPCIYVPNYDFRYSCIAPRLSGDVRVVGVCHSDDSQHYEHLAQLAPYWDAVVGVSRTISESLASLMPGTGERQWTIPYGVTVKPEIRRERDGPIHVVYAGRIARYQKRCQDLPLIAGALRARGIPAELTVVGAGQDDDGTLAATEGIHFTGGVPNGEVMRILGESDVFILPSSFEGFPLSVLEAMARGCVPIVTDIRSGIPELIADGENGFVVPVGSADAFAGRVAILAADRERLRRMQEAARATVCARHDIEHVTTKFLEMFASVASDESARPAGRIVPPPILAGPPSSLPRLPLSFRNALAAFRQDGR
jgi:glycosyltransferase involved in cell wall biosynthesis